MEGNHSVTVNNVSVRYRKEGSQRTSDIIKRILGKGAADNGTWALRNISFTLDKGDMLGVIGRNGAGKSTLMKAISGTLIPASGSIEKEGKLCALLELGTGFDREMTVRENIFLRGALLGYPRELIEAKYDEIIDYADMREFQDSPFRTLSSGMKSRIAFAIASTVRPDIIILDEIFAVGDGDFRKKSQETMQEIIGSGETTAIIVSHSLSAVRRQCNKVLWLNKGRMVMFGDPDTVCSEYEKYLKTRKLPDTESLRATEDNPPNRLKKTAKRRIAEACVYLLLLAFAAAGVFFWSQYDLFRADRIASRSDAAVIESELGALHSELDELLGVDCSGWDTDGFREASELADSDEATLREAAKAALGGVTDKYELSAAELRIVRELYTEKLRALFEDIASDYAELSPESRPSLRRYAYSRIDELYKLEKDCDADAQEVVDGIRDQLRRDGLPEATADKLMSVYREAKVYSAAYFMEALR